MKFGAFIKFRNFLFGSEWVKNVSESNYLEPVNIVPSGQQRLCHGRTSEVSHAHSCGTNHQTKLRHSCLVMLGFESQGDPARALM